MLNITPVRECISERFPVASFVVSVPPDRYFEVACATDPRLFRPDQQHRRTPSNFSSSRQRGLLRAPAGQVTYIIPPQQLRRFAGAQRLYYAIGAYRGARNEDAVLTLSEARLDQVPSVRISPDFTGRSFDRGRLEPAPARYGGEGAPLVWGGDDVMRRSAPPVTYDDGFDAALWDGDGAAGPNIDDPPAHPEGTGTPHDCWLTYDGGSNADTYGTGARFEGARARYGQAQDLSTRRLRSSIWMGDPGDVLGGWADREHGRLARDPSKVASRAGLVDDLTLLTTIHMSRERGVSWRNDNVVPLFSDALALCHEHKIQLHAGYTIADEGTTTGTRSKLFVDWIRNPVNPTPAEHAAAIVRFLWDDHRLDFDGIGFDLELNGLRPEHKSVFIDFYGHLAELLAARGKVLSIATGIGDIGAEHQVLGTFAAQPFEIARGHANVIMRPMCYDMFSYSDEKLERWRAHAIAYALDTVGLQPGQLQLGLKTSNNSDIWTKHGKERPAGWSPRKCCLDAAGVADFSRRHLRPRGVGVITFAGFTDAATINEGLNAGCPPAGTSGEPVQQPLP